MNNEEIQANKKKKQKEKLITDIQKNFKSLEEIFKTKKVQEIFNSIGLFSFEEYSKFFQNLSNKEFIAKYDAITHDFSVFKGLLYLILAVLCFASFINI